MDYLKPLADYIDQLNARIAALEAKVNAGQSTPAAASTSRAAPTPAAPQLVKEEPLPSSLVAYDELTRTLLQPFLDAGKKLGADAAKLSAIVESAFAGQRQFLLMASRCKKPANPQDLLPALSAIQQAIKDVAGMRDNRSEWANHQNTVNEGIQSLSWLTVEPSPVSFIESFVGGADFWGNKIRVQYKSSNPDQVAFVNTFKALLLGLMDYVKEHHKTGVTWNPRGTDLATYKAQGGAAASTARPASPRRPVSPKPAAKEAPASASLSSYDEILEGPLSAFVESGNKVGGDPGKLTSLVKQAFDAHRNLLVAATKCSKPSSQKDFQAALEDIQTPMREIFSSKDNRSPWSSHQNAIAEGIQCLGWVGVEPAPIPFIESYIDGSEFWSNKIRVQCKTSDPDQVAFVNNFKSLLMALKNYVKSEHTAGLSWNKQGVDYVSYKATQGAAGTAAAPAVKVEKPPAAAMGGLFASIKSIDQSQGKTAGLKHVTKEQQTWRKEYQGAGTAPAAKAAPSPPKPAAAAVEGPKGQPVKELRQDKWIIENQGKGHVEIDVELKQQVMIYNCIGGIVKLNGKCKSIAIDKCSKMGVIFDNAVSAVEVVNSKRVQIQVNGKVPSAAIDKSDGILLHLSAQCAQDILIASSKSSEMNVQFPGKDGELIERPIPEQFVHRIENEQISSQVSDLYSH